MSAVTAAPDLLRALQERAARALPAIHVQHRDGWWLRHGDTSAWWASSVLPHGNVQPGELPDRIERAEAFYAAHDAPARFQITPEVCPTGLDGALAERGYRRHSPISLQSAPTRHVIDRLPRSGLWVDVADQPSDAWLETWLAVHGIGDDPGHAERDMLRRVGGPSAYLSASAGTDVVAVGRAVIETCWAGSDNAAALRLYERAGFTEVCRYHYRTARRTS